MHRLARAASDEVVQLRPTTVLAEAVSRALPTQTFGHTRTMVLRAAGFKIGPRSMILGPVHLTGRDKRVDLLTIGADCLVGRGRAPRARANREYLRPGPLHLVRGALNWR